MCVFTCAVFVSNKVTNSPRAINKSYPEPEPFSELITRDSRCEESAPVEKDGVDQTESGARSSSSGFMNGDERAH